MSERKTLNQLLPGESGRVYGVSSGSRTRRRIVDMGITPGTQVRVVKAAPMGDPIEISLRGYGLSLRREEAENILLMREDEAENLGICILDARTGREDKGRIELRVREHESDTDLAQHERAAKLTEFVLESPSYRPECQGCTGFRCDKCAKAGAHRPGEQPPVRLALVGNPNSGKTTLFNAMTGSREYVGNWPGVTVEKKEGKIKRRAEEKDGLCTFGHDMTLVDLPGVYSLSPYSMEELVARDYILNEKPEAIVNIIDGTNLERNLYLTVQLLELERPLILALNMMDEVEKRGDKIDCKRLSLELGVPVIPISARTGKGVEDLVESAQKLILAAHSQMDEGFNIEPDDVYDAYTHAQHHRICELVAPYAKAAGLPLHWTGIKLLEGDGRVREKLALTEEISRKVEALVGEYAGSTVLGDNETLLADSRYAYVERVCGAALVRGTKKNDASARIDAVLTNKYLAVPLFLLIMTGIFALTFGTLGAWLSDAVAGGVAVTVTAVGAWLSSLAAPAWLISLINDGVLSGVGGVLTFLPQIAILFFCLSLLEDSGYMSRIAFIMDRPMGKLGLSGKSFIPLLMGFGCTVPATMGARATDNVKDKRMTILLLPFMSCSAKLPVYGMLAGAFFAKGRLLVIASLYGLGVVLGVLTGALFKRTLFKGQNAPFLIELPPYRMPTARNTLDHVWERVSHFLEKAGSIILMMSVVLWFLQSFDFSLRLTQDATNSILGGLGGVVAPLLKPLGFGTWQAAVALLTGIVAKEAVVSSLSLFYGIGAAAGEGAVRAALSSTFTPLSAYAFMVFVLLYTPCMAAVATMRRELGSGKWTAFAVAYQCGFAYLVAFLVYTMGRLLL